jgi:hypothetical protein
MSPSLRNYNPWIEAEERKPLVSRHVDQVIPQDDDAVSFVPPSATPRKPEFVQRERQLTRLKLRMQREGQIMGGCCVDVCRCCTRELVLL